MSRWFRMYADAMRHPKVVGLSDADFRMWVNLLAIASDNDGIIPPLSASKYLLRGRIDGQQSSISRLIEAGLVDQLEEGYCPHNWKKRQYISDTSTPRVQKHRAKGNVSETPPETEADTEADKEVSAKAESHPKRVRVKYSDQFENDFWKPYPRSPIMSKAETLKAWEKLTDEDRAAACAAVPRFAAHCRANQTYEPVHACRFLSQRRFDGFQPEAVVDLVSRVFVVQGTPQWAAWVKHRGKEPPTTQRGSETGWFFISEWPPDATITGTLPLADRTQANGESRDAAQREGPRLQATR